MKKNIFIIVCALSIPFAAHAEESELSIALGKFFNHKIEGLVFKPAPNVVIFESDVRNSGMTYIPNPMGGLKPIGSLNLINIPARVLVNLSNFVMKEVRE